MQYPDELNMYPFEHEGYRDHTGLYTACVRRPELPQSLSKHGKPPEHPYESVRFFVFVKGSTDRWVSDFGSSLFQFVVYV
jgi:hypothetical protein